MSERPIAGAAAIASVTVGTIVLLGWVADLGTLKRIAPGLPSMKANTAIGFVLSGLALWLVRDGAPTRWRSRVATGLALLVALFALLTLAEYAFDVDLGIDGLFHDSEMASDGFPGRTSPHSALAFVALGAWLATIASPRLRIGRPMSVIACVVVLFAGVGYLYGVDYLRGASTVNGVALHSLFLFGILCAGLVAVRPEASFLAGLTSRGPGGQVVRRLVPGFVGLGALLGLLRAATADVYGTTGTGLLVGVIIVLGVGVVLVTARTLDRVDAERRRLQQDILRRSESRLEAIVETTNELIGTIDRDGVWTYVNPASRQIYGREPDDTIGRRLTDSSDPEQLGADLAALGRVLGGETIRGHETLHRRADGTSVAIAFNAVPIRDEQGAVVGAIATGDDITDRYTAAIQARIAHERLEAVLDRTPALVFMKDVDGRYTYANHAVEEFLALPREQIVGKDDATLFPPRTAEELWRIDREVIERREALRHEEHIEHPDGLRAFVYLCVKFPLYDPAGRLVEVCGVATDITELKRRQDELERRRDEQAAISALGATALQGVALDELAARAAQGVLDLVPVEVCRIERIADDGTATRLGEASRPGASPGDGATTFLLVSHERRLGSLTVSGGAADELDSDAAAVLQTIANVLATAIDRDDAQEALEERFREIAELAAARGRLVSEALAAEDRERARLSEALHDDALQSLLAVRQDLAEAERAPERAAEIAGRARGIVEATASGLRDLVSSVHPVTLEHAGLETALASIGQFHASRGGFEVAVTVDGQPGESHGPLLLRIARELLANAEKHAQARRVDVSLRGEDGTVVLQVEDDGRGMVDGRTAAALREGHIGLASAAERARALGGTFDLWSEPGSGTRVRVTLPATEGR